MRLVQEGAELGARRQPARGIRGDGLEQHRADREVRGRDDADARAFGLFAERVTIRGPARRPDDGVQLQCRVAADVVADGIRSREIHRDVGRPSHRVGQPGARGILSLVEHADDLAIELRRQRLDELGPSDRGQRSGGECQKGSSRSCRHGQRWLLVKIILGQGAPVSYRYFSKMLLHVISFAVVLVPGLHRWWSGRRFRNANEDPALAERWWALRTRATQVSFFSRFVAACLSPAWMGLLLPVQWLASAIGGFPARRVIFGESWTLGAYLFWSFRLAAGMWGFWIVLATLPLGLPRLRRLGRPSGRCTVDSLAALVRLASQVVPRRDTARRRGHFARARRGLFPGASGVDRACARPVASRTAGVDAGQRRGAAGHPQVVGPVLQRPARRADACRSHRDSGARDGTPRALHAPTADRDVAHLDRAHRRSRHSCFRGCRKGPMNLLVSLWPLVLLGTLALRMRWRQEHETASDRRAVELCGDPDALASGLTKLYALGRVPRRWSASVEQRASHPSLARRLAAIRGRSGHSGGARRAGRRPGRRWHDLDHHRARSRAPSGRRP